MKIENMAISALRPNPRNARTHSRKQIRQIADSIERFGFCNPVLIDDDNQIIAGHERAKAAALLNLAEVPTVRLSHLSDNEKRAYILADNRLAEKAGWDREIVVTELQHLLNVGFEVDLTGFEPAEVDAFFDELTDDQALGTNDRPISNPRSHDPVIFGSSVGTCCCAELISPSPAQSQPDCETAQRRICRPLVADKHRFQGNGRSEKPELRKPPTFGAFPAAVWRRTGPLESARKTGGGSVTTNKILYS